MSPALISLVTVTRSFLLLLWPVACGLWPFLSGCMPSFTVPDMTEEERRRLPDCSGMNEEQMLAELDRRHSLLHDLQGLVLAYLKTPDRSGTFDAAMVLQWPSSMRVKAFRGGGATFMDLALHDGGVTLFLPGESKAYVAALDDPIPIAEGKHTLSARQMVRCLALGSRSGDPALRLTTRRSDAWIVRHVSPDRSARDEVYDPKTFFLRRVTILSPEGQPMATAEYSEYRLGDEFWFPRLMEVADGAGNFRFKILLKEPRINQGLVPEALTLTLPEGVEIVRKKQE